MLNRMNLIWGVYLIITMKKMGFFFQALFPFVFSKDQRQIPLMYSAILGLLLSADQQQIICLHLTLASSSVITVMNLLSV